MNGQDHIDFWDKNFKRLNDFVECSGNGVLTKILFYTIKNSAEFLSSFASDD